MNTLLTLILVVTGLNLVLFSTFCWSLFRFYRVVSTFFAPAGDNLPSPASLILDSVLSRAADLVMLKLKTTLMGVASGQSRAEKAVELEVAGAALQDKSPLLAAGLAAFPKLSKTLLGNPAIIQFIMSKIGSGVQAPLIPDSSPSDFGARLGRYGG